MSDPGQNRNKIIINLILILLVLVLIYVIYYISGGDPLGLINPGANSGGGNPISRLVDSLRGFGRGLQDLFSGMVR